ncbi:MAG TPA: tetratricopeptide repeat protein [Pyrinomonadaceae bacterium]|nr:tetratricopeptide repeat protein [Pyrinomonadaceae bacterium]
MSQTSDDRAITKNAASTRSRDSVIESIVQLNEDKASSVVGDQTHQLRRLIQTLHNRKGRFALIFVVCNEVPLRRALTREVKENLSDQDLFELHLTGTEHSLLDKLLKVPGTPHPLFVYGLDNLLPSSDKDKLRREETFQELQLRREQFHLLDRPLVLWMPEYVYTLIGQQAVDFWSWQSGTFFFTEVQSRKVGIDQTSEATGESKEEFQKHDARQAIRHRLKQLPTPPRDFTGRVPELEELRRALGQGGVTISGVQGMGGVGKTALALVLAHEFKDLYPDAQIYLDLKGVSLQPLTPAEVMWHVVSSFHPDMKRPDDAELPAWYSDLLNRHRALLFYDNAKDDTQIEPLLPPPHCLLLVTSRRHFQVPGMFHKNLEEMTGADAEALLCEIAPRIGTDAAAIAKQCGYLPLALRLAASALHKSRALSPADVLRRLQDKRKRVALVEASFTLSYELLSDELQRRWRTLAVFPADFDAPAAAAVWQTEVDTAKDSLTELEEYSLLDWEEPTGRYALHDLARDFADTHLSDIEREQSSFLHAAHYLQLLSTTDELFLKGGEAIARGLSLFDKERVNIEAGQEWAAARFADNEPAAHLCNRYPDVGIYVLNLRQHPRDFIRWLEAALSAARQLKDHTSEGSHIGNLGVAYAELSETRRAIELYEQRLAMAREVGDQHGMGAALGNLGNAYDDLGETRRAIEFYEQQLTITREIGDRRGEGNALGNLGNAYAALGDTRRAIEFYEQHLSIAREVGDLRGEGSTLGNLGNAYVNLGEPRRAIEFHGQNLAMAREIGDRRGEGAALGNLGVAYSNLGEPRRAIEFYKEQLAITDEIGDRRGTGNALSNLGGAYAILGEPKKMAECLEAALKIYEEIESPHANIVRGWLEKLRSNSG